MLHIKLDLMDLQFVQQLECITGSFWVAGKPMQQQQRCGANGPTLGCRRMTAANAELCFLAQLRMGCRVC